MQSQPARLSVHDRHGAVNRVPGAEVFREAGLISTHSQNSQTRGCLPNVYEVHLDVLMAMCAAQPSLVAS